MKNPVAPMQIERRIYCLRGARVLLDGDLALLYGVTTKNLNKAVKRNSERFPADFMFRLDPVEARALRFQIGTSKPGRGGSRYLPFAFTEQGVAMLSSVLRSRRAIQVNIAIMRVFGRLKHLLTTHYEFARKLSELEQRIAGHDNEIQTIFAAIRQLTANPPPTTRKIGFRVSETGARYRANPASNRRNPTR